MALPRAGTFAVLFLLALLACNTPPDPPPAPPEAATPEAEVAVVGCVNWTGDEVMLSPTAEDPRHHASFAWSSAGLLAGWQVGNEPATIAVRTFDAALQPTSEETTVSGADRRATHPQVAAHAEHASIVWTREDDGALRWAELDAEAKPKGEARTIAQVPGAPQRYGDLTYLPDGTALALRLADRAGRPSWPVSGVGSGTSYDVTTLAGTNAGGPGALRVDGQGRAWAAWAELAVAGEDDATATLRLLALQGDAAAQFSLAVLNDNIQRTSLAFNGDQAVVGWTRYATRNKGWGVGLGVFNAADGTKVGDPGTIGSPGARMLDLDAAGGVIVAGWEAPHLGQDRELWIQVFDSAGQPRCEAELAHPKNVLDDTRAQILMRQRDNGTVEGIVAWQRGPHPRDQQVWARPFVVAATSLPPSATPEPVVEEAAPVEGAVPAEEALPAVDAPAEEAAPTSEEVAPSAPAEEAAPAEPAPAP